MKKKILDIVIITNLFIIFILTILVKTVDIYYNVITKSNIGLYSLNKLFLNNNEFQFLKIISEIIFIICLLIIVIIGAMLIINYIKTKAINKKQKNFLIYLFILFIIWVLFDKVLIINYRPIVVDGKIEGSYPSTHIMVITYTLLSLSYLLENKVNQKMKYILSIIFILITFSGRVLSLMHWFTDGLCGLLVGLTFYLLFLRSNYGFNNKI